MLAVQMRGYGGPEALEAREASAPLPGPGEVVVATSHAGVNRADLFIRSGTWPQAGGWPYVPGLECCGTVAAAGEGSELRTGERVITMMQGLGGIHGRRAGGYQERVLLPASTLARLPASLSLADAAALGLPAVTALLALERLEVAPGARLLVHAGSSAVGLAAIQIARHRGATVVATGTSPGKFDAIRDAGAAEVISTREEGWSRGVAQVDRVLDLVGSATFAPTVELMAPGGRLVFAGGTSGGDLALSGWSLMRPVTITGYSSETLTAPELARAMVDLAELVRSGAIRVPIPSCFPLARAADAHRAMEEGRITGRVLLVPVGAATEEGHP